MADEDLSLNEDQLLDSLDDANGDSELMNEVRCQHVNNMDMTKPCPLPG